MALFEISPHPEQTEERQLSMLRLLDGIIRALNLTTIDVDDPCSSVFPVGLPPALPQNDIEVVYTHYILNCFTNVLRSPG